jgi:hypothetical protein
MASTDELKNQALQIAINSFLEAKSFVLSQAPDVVQQLLLWNIWLRVSLLIGFTVFLVVGTLTFNKLNKKLFEIDDDGFLPFVHTILFLGATVGILTSSIFKIIPELIQLIVAPKIWLLEYAAHLAGIK